MKQTKSAIPAAHAAHDQPIPWRVGLYTMRASTLLMMIAFFLPWLKIGCVQVDGSVSEEVLTGYSVAWGTKLMGDDFQDRKYWLLLLSPAAIAVLSFWRSKRKIARNLYRVASVLVLAALVSSVGYLVHDFFFTDAKPYSERQLHQFQFYFGNWAGFALQAMLLACVALAWHAGKHRGWSTQTYAVWMLVAIVAFVNAGYLFSEFLLDDEPPPARVTYEICYGFWLALSACAGILAGAVITIVQARRASRHRQA